MRNSLKKRQKGIIVITLAVLALFAVLFSRGLELRKRKAELERQVAILKEEETAAYERTDELKERRSYMSTIRYIEDLAREKLGLVYKDEVIFKEKDDDEE
ncbi:MAG: septum formation initiator family protein [Lachnospiraceae bacterium]|nr:septum formation initiator family protein [Lachnospiraceae bacterium]